jgi:AbrB family looped-hinge helix DNA binding protein
MLATSRLTATYPIRDTIEIEAMKQAHVGMGPNGRLVIPAALRAELGLEAGGPLLARVEDGKVVLEPLSSVVRRVQARVQRYVPPSTDLAAELEQDRRRAARDE